MTTSSNLYAVALRSRPGFFHRLHRALRENREAMALLMAYIDQRGRA